MKKIILSAFTALVILGAALFVGEKPAEAPAGQELMPAASYSDESYQKAEVTIGGRAFSALVADTPELRTLGLSGRKGLGEDEAMLFIFDKPEAAGFWMKDMLFSIDIAWIGGDGRIVTIAERVSPETFPQTFFPARPVKYVVELPAGTIGSLGAKEGDLASIAVGK